MNQFVDKLLTKLTSRKLWLAIAGVTTGIAIALNVDAGEIETICGSVTTIISALAYIISEATVDRAALASKSEVTENESE